MRDLYSDDYESIAADVGDRLIPSSLQRAAGAAVFLGLIAAMGLWAYRLGTRDATEVPVIHAMEGPARIKPEEPGGLQAAHQGLEVNTVLGGSPAPMPRDAAPAVPQPAVLRAEDEPQGELVLATPAAMAERVLGERVELPAPNDGVDPLAPMPAPETAAAGDVAATTAGPRPRSRPSNLVIARAAPTPARAAATKPAAARPAPPAHEVIRPDTGTRLVQLGAFDSEAITRQAWNRLVDRNGDLLASKSLYVERTTANARVFYRLRVAGFANADETRQMCEALRARGIDCIPVTLQ